MGAPARRRGILPRKSIHKRHANLLAALDRQLFLVDHMIDYFVVHAERSSLGER